MPKNTPGNVLSNIRKDPSGCHIWAAYVMSEGYGQCRYQGKLWLAHRLVFILSGGEIPDGLQLDHLCRNRRCVNPAHLEPVTQAENSRRGISGQFLIALNGSKTHCPHGHEYSAENTRIDANGARVCKKCKSIQARRHRDQVTRFDEMQKRGIVCKGCPARFWQTPVYHGNYCEICRASRRQVRAWKYGGMPEAEAKAKALVAVWEGR